MAEMQDMMTNEVLMGERFASPFDLVNYAIDLAVDAVKRGRDSRVKTDIKNRAYQILEEIAQGKDVLQQEETLEEARIEEEVEVEVVLETEMVSSEVGSKE